MLRSTGTRHATSHRIEKIASLSEAPADRITNKGMPLRWIVMPDVILLALAQRPPSRLGDPQSGDLDPVIARDHALGRHAREPGADQLDQHLDREAVREHDRLGAAIAAGCEQFERAAVGGGRVALARAA